MEDETLRYTTFAAFPQSCPIGPSQLSAAGFHYKGKEDEVVCHKCGFKYKNWQMGDNPLKLHQQKSPACEIVCNPNENENENSSARELNYRHDRAAGNVYHVISLTRASEQSQERPRHPDCSYVNNAWPDTSTISQNDLAESGFFYTGTSDIVRCYHCGDVEKPGDDPFVGLARRCPSCPYIKQCKECRLKMDVHMQSTRCSLCSDIPESDEQLFQHSAVLGVRLAGNYTDEQILEAVTLLKSKQKAGFTAENIMQCLLDIEDLEEAEQKKKDDDKKRRVKQGQQNIIMSRFEELIADVDQLKEENQSLRDRKTCKVCLDEEAIIVFLPCGHLVTCPMCASALRTCPVCRTVIRGTVKAILS